MTPVAARTAAAIKVNGVAVASGTASPPIALAVGENVITIEVTAADGINTQTYTVTVVRLPEPFSFSSATRRAADGEQFGGHGRHRVHCAELRAGAGNQPHCG